MRPVSVTREELILVAVVGLVGGLAAAVFGSMEQRAMLAGTPVTPSQTDIRIDLFGAELKLEPRGYPGLDLFVSWALMATAGVACFSAVLARRAGLAPRIRRFFWIAAAGAALLGADEWLTIHESVGDAIVVELAGPVRGDDVIIALYAIAGIAFLVRFRAVLLASSSAVVLFCCGVASALVSVALDATHRAPVRVEDGFEVLAATFLLAGFGLLAADLLTAQPESSRSRSLRSAR